MKVNVKREDPPPPPPPPVITEITVTFTPEELEVILASMGSTNGLKVSEAVRASKFSSGRFPNVARMQGTEMNIRHYNIYQALVAGVAGTTLGEGAVVK